MFAAVAVIMLCAVAIIGVGYAYTAQTNNSGNDVTSEYITLTQSGEGKYKFANDLYVYYNTVNTGVDETTYTLAQKTMALNGINGGKNYTVVKLGKTLYMLCLL